MMCLRTVEGAAAIEAAQKPLPFGPEITEDLDGVTRLEVLAATWDDSEDYTVGPRCG